MIASHNEGEFIIGSASIHFVDRGFPKNGTRGFVLYSRRLVMIPKIDADHTPFSRIDLTKFWMVKRDLDQYCVDLPRTPRYRDTSVPALTWGCH